LPFTFTTKAFFGEECVMSNDIIKGHWKELKGKVKQQWGNLTDDEVTQMKGTYEELEGKLQKKYGYDKERVKKEIQSFIDKNGLSDTDTDNTSH
jgi:uncharacterized protein YjbJ (UPF0337 family)